MIQTNPSNVFQGTVPGECVTGRHREMRQRRLALAGAQAERRPRLEARLEVPEERNAQHRHLSDPLTSRACTLKTAGQDEC